MLKNKKTAARAVILYLILTAGLWMFIDSYTNFYNRITGEQIAPASVTLNGENASLSLLEHDAEVDLSIISPESKAYCIAYTAAPDELRLAGLLISFCSSL